MSSQEINQISGPQFLSGLVNSGLLGVLSVQVYLYFLAFPNDHRYLKCLVYGIYVLEFAQSVLIIDAGFRTFVPGFRDVEGFNRVRTLWLSIPILTAIDTFFVQGFYAHRISILAQSKKVAGAIIALSFIQLGGGIMVGVHSEQEKYLQTSDRLVFQATSLGMWLIGSVLCDIIIAVCMIYYLSKYDVTIKRTKIILQKVLRLTIETGSLTAVIGILCFVLSNIPDTPYYYQFPMGIIGKVYATSMLVLINSRIIVRVDSEELPSTITSPVRFGTARSNDEGTTIDHTDFSSGTMTPKRGREM